MCESSVNVFQYSKRSIEYFFSGGGGERFTNSENDKRKKGHQGPLSTNSALIVLIGTQHRVNPTKITKIYLESQNLYSNINLNL